MYVSNHLSLVEEQRQHVDSIAKRTALFLAAGGTIYQGKSPSINPPPPPRSTNRSRNHPQAPKAAHYPGRA